MIVWRFTQNMYKKKAIIHSLCNTRAVFEYVLTIMANEFFKQF